MKNTDLIAIIFFILFFFVSCFKTYFIVETISNELGISFFKAFLIYT